MGEEGVSVPDAELLVHLAEALGTSVENLLNGSPCPPDAQDSAADLGAQLAELNRLYARQQEHRRIFWRIVCILIAATSLMILAVAGVAMLYSWLEYRELAAAVGVIGGADGPTTVFFTKATPQWISILLIAGIGAASLAGVWHTRRHDASEK